MSQWLNIFFLKSLLISEWENFAMKAFIDYTCCSVKYSVSRLAQHAALHKAYKPAVSITHVCPCIPNLPL